MRNKGLGMRSEKRTKNRGMVNCLTLLPLVAYLFFCVSCDNMLQPQKKIAKPAAGYGRVAITAAGASARTVFPDAAFEKYEYEFAKVTNGIRGEPEPQKPEDGLFTLALGEWQVTVKAYAQADDAEPTASGTSATFEVTNAGTKEVFVRLTGNTTPDSKGDFKYNIKYPKGAEITAFTLDNLLDGAASAVTLTPITGQADTEDENTLIAEGGKASVPAGLYWLTVKLKLPDETATGANEVVYVYDGLTSEYRAVFVVDNFTLPLFTVTFDADGGSPTPPPQAVSKDGKAAKPADPTLAGFELDYWYNTAGIEKWDFDVDTITGDITLKASWKPEGATVQYTVTFDPDNDTTAITQKVWQGAKAPAPQGITKDGHRFDGWYTTSDAKWDFDTLVTGDLSLKAKWVKVWNVIFQPDNNEVNITRQVDDGTLVTPEDLTRTGYNFVHWYDISGSEDTAFDFTTPITEDLTLKAKWQIKTFTVTFYRSSNDTTTETVNWNTAVARPSPDPTLAGKAFKNWYTEQTGETLYNFSTLVTADISIWAQWDFVLPLADVNDIRLYLKEQAGGTTADNPVALNSTIISTSVDLGDTSEQGSNWWSIVNEIGEADKYVTLDLSNFTMTGTAFETNSSLHGTGKERIVGIVLPNTTTSVEGFSYSFSSLATVTIPASVTSIGWQAFASCTGLTGITFATGSQLQTIGGYAFNFCNSLTNITLPEGVTSIGTWAFAYCTSLTSITIPAGVTSIGGSAFQNCSSLTSITVDASNPNYADEGGILYNKAKTSLITAPGAISGNVTIPAGVTSIDTSAFNRCDSLTGITIPAGVTSIGDSTFAYCTSLASVTIPAGVTSIGTWAFSGCTSLTSITIPASVTSISDHSFFGSSSLATVTCLATTPPSLGGESAFALTDSGLQIKVPAASVDTYKEADKWKYYADNISAID